MRGRATFKRSQRLRRELNSHETRLRRGGRQGRPSAQVIVSQFCCVAAGARPGQGTISQFVGPPLRANRSRRQGRARAAA